MSRRLGVIEEGETAFRILDPALENDATVTSHGTEQEPRGTWYETLWESVTEPELLEPDELPPPPADPVIPDNGTGEPAVPEGETVQ